MCSEDDRSSQSSHDLLTLEEATGDLNKMAMKYTSIPVHDSENPG